MTIERSSSLNYQEENKPENVHDGKDQLNTWYSVKDGAVAGNFLKLYLTKSFSITEVRIWSKKRAEEWIVNTEVRVYSVANEETEVASCGKITCKHERVELGNDRNRDFCLSRTETVLYFFCCSTEPNRARAFHKDLRRQISSLTVGAQQSSIYGLFK